MRPIAEILPTTAPIMAPELELPPLPDDDESLYEGDGVGGSKGDEVVSGKVVGFGEVLGVGPPVVELEMPINPPGPISGLSEKIGDVKRPKEIRRGRRFLPPTPNDATASQRERGSRCHMH